jgi:tetratricopeptide (TPR) repeat protein
LDAIARVRGILDEVRSALEWLLGEGSDAGLALEAASGLGRFWWLGGRPAEGRAWLDRALAAAPQAEPAVRAEALHWSGVLADEERMALLAAERLKQALVLRRALGDERGIARTLNSLGVVARSMGDLDGAEVLFEESLRRKRVLGDDRGVAATLSNLGLLAADRDDLATARTRLEEALALDRASGEQGAETYSLLNLGAVEIWLGRVDEGAAIVRRALAVFAEIEAADGVAASIEALGEAALGREDPLVAARLLSVARAVRIRAGAPLRDIEARRVDAAFAVVQRRVPPERLAALEVEASALDAPAAASLALALT